MKKALRRAQRIFRNQGVEAGKPTTKNIRWTLTFEGKEEALRKLRQAERYARGIAYPENVQSLAAKLSLEADKLPGKLGEELEKIARHLFKHQTDDTISESQLKDALDVVGSPFGKGTTDSEYAEIIRNLKEIFKM